MCIISREGRRIGSVAARWEGRGEVKGGGEGKRVCRRRKGKKDSVRINGAMEVGEEGR